MARPTRYQVEHAVLAPRTAWRRRRFAVDDQFLRAALELHDYRQPLVDFIAATAASPDILHAFDLGPHDVVVDVGAYDGSWAASVLERGPGRLVAFEPDPAALAKLRHRLEGDERVRIEPAALAGADGELTLAQEGPGSTLHATGPGTFGSAVVSVRDVDAAFAELGIGEVALLKVNIEGGEYDLLERMVATGRLADCRQVLVQFHPWLPRAHARRRALRRAMAESHREVWCYDFVWERWERR